MSRPDKPDHTETIKNTGGFFLGLFGTVAWDFLCLVTVIDYLSDSVYIYGIFFILIPGLVIYLTFKYNNHFIGVGIFAAQAILCLIILLIIGACSRSMHFG